MLRQYYIADHIMTIPEGHQTSKWAPSCPAGCDAARAPGVPLRLNLVVLLYFFPPSAIVTNAQKLDHNYPPGRQRGRHLHLLGQIILGIPQRRTTRLFRSLNKHPGYYALVYTSLTDCRPETTRRMQHPSTYRRNCSPNSS